MILHNKNEDFNSLKSSIFQSRQAIFSLEYPYIYHTNVTVSFIFGRK